MGLERQDRACRQYPRCRYRGDGREGARQGLLRYNVRKQITTLATRREFLVTIPAATALTGFGQRPDQQPAPRALTPGQLKTLEAFIDRLIPEDENGPGAVAAGAQDYINIQLAGYLAPEK